MLCDTPDQMDTIASNAREYKPGVWGIAKPEEGPLPRKWRGRIKAAWACLKGDAFAVRWFLIVLAIFGLGCETASPDEASSSGEPTPVHNVCSPPGSEDWPGTWHQPHWLIHRDDCDGHWQPIEQSDTDWRWDSWRWPYECGSCRR